MTGKRRVGLGSVVVKQSGGGGAATASKQGGGNKLIGLISTRNMAKVVQTDIKHLNVYDVLNADKVVIEESALAYINDFYGESGAAWA